jgi:MtN3 and saliva related transmembrane protein
MTSTEIIGALAATLTTVAFVPQALKAIRYRDTRSLSLGMYVIFTSGVMLWGLYGYLRGDWVIITANSITCVLCLAILMIKLAEKPDASRHHGGTQHDRE